MNYLIALGLFICAYVVGLFGWSSILITIRFGIPYAWDLARQGILESMYARAISAAYKKANILWTVIFLAISAVVIIFVPVTIAVIGYFIGLLFSFLSIFRKSGPTDDNITEFVHRHAHLIDTGNGLEESVEEKLSLLKGAESLRKLNLLATGQKWPGVYK